MFVPDFHHTISIYADNVMCVFYFKKKILIVRTHLLFSVRSYCEKTKLKSIIKYCTRLAVKKYIKISFVFI